MKRALWIAGGAAEPLAAASDAACDPADRIDLGDRAVERRAGAEPAGAQFSYDRAAATFGGARTAMLVGRDGATFPQQLFVDLRRAGWPVSPVLEGRIQIGGRSFRLLGIEPVTLPAEVGNAPAIGKADLQSFITPPGEMLVAPETLSDLKLPEGATAVGQRRHAAAAAARAAATRARRAGGRYRHRAAAAENAGPGFAAA